MNKLNFIVNQEEIQKQPSPMNFAWRYRPDSMMTHLYKVDHSIILEREKRMASQALAEMIFKHCQWFDLTTFGFDNELQIEIVICDRGAYQNMLPNAKAQGIKEGRKIERMNTPYGLLDDTEFY